MKNYNDYQLTQKQLSRISYYKKRSFIARSLRKHGVMPTDEQIANVTAVTESDVQVYKPVFYTTEQYQEEFTVGPESLEPIDDGGEIDWNDSGENTGGTPTDISGDTEPEVVTASTVDITNWHLTTYGLNGLQAKLVDGLGLVFNSFEQNETSQKKVKVKIGTQDRQHMNAYWSDTDEYYTPDLTTESAAGVDTAYLSISKNSANTANDIMLLGQLSGATGINSNNIHWETMPVYVDKPHKLLINNPSYSISYNQLTSITVSVVNGFEISAYCSSNMFTVSTSTQNNVSRVVITNKTVNETGNPIVATVKTWVKSPTTNMWLDTNKTITVTQRQNTANSLTLKVTLSGCSEWQFSGILYTNSGLTEGIQAENWTAKDYRDYSLSSSSSVVHSCTITGATAATIYGIGGIWYRASGSKTLSETPQVRVGGELITPTTFTTTSCTFSSIRFASPKSIQNNGSIMIYFAKP